MAQSPQAGATRSLCARPRCFLADHYEDLAHHYRRSGSRLKAVNYLHLTAQQAISRSAYEEAAHELETGLEMLRTAPNGLERDRAEINLLTTLALCIFISGRLGATPPMEMLERARAICEKVGDDVMLFEVLEALALRIGALASDPSVRQKWRAICEELPGIAQKTEDPEMIGRARFDLATSLFQDARFPEAVEQFEQAYHLAPNAFSRKRQLAPNPLGPSFGALSVWVLGYPDRAIARSREVLAAAHKSGALDVVIAKCWYAQLNLPLRDWKMGYTLADEAPRSGSALISRCYWL
jgi:tetratricopeptide (TPR) repeat protein